MPVADAAHAWSAWPYAAPIRPAVRAAGYVRAELPPEITPDGSLRVVDDRGVETPYVLAARLTRDERVLPLLDVREELGDTARATVDFGASGTSRTAVRLVAAQAHFRTRAIVETSDDRRAWRIARVDAPVVDERIGRPNSAILDFPPTAARYVRIRIPHPRTGFTLIDATEVSPALAAERPLRRIAGLKVVAAPPRFGQSVWTFAAAAPARVAVVRFVGGIGAFARDVRVEVSSDGERWIDSADGAIERFARGSPRLDIPTPEAPCAYYRVTVMNRNDRPIPGLRPELLGRATGLIFAAAPDRGYRLLWGVPMPTADGPTYDLPERLAHERWTAAPASVGTPGPNFAYRDPRGVTERYPQIMPYGFAALALALCLAAARMLAKPVARTRDGEED